MRKKNGQKDKAATLSHLRDTLFAFRCTGLYLVSRLQWAKAGQKYARNDLYVLPAAIEIIANLPTKAMIFDQCTSNTGIYSSITFVTKLDYITSVEATDKKK